MVSGLDVMRVTTLEGPQFHGSAHTQVVLDNPAPE